MASTTTHSNDASLFEIVEEVVNLSVGLVIVLLPALILAVPGLIVFIVLPAVALLAVAAVPAALLAPLYLLYRLGRR